MWLLYVTFEDFICLSHPGHSAAVLSNRVDINNHIKTTKRLKSKQQSNDKAIEETCEVSSQILNLRDEHQNLNELELSFGEVICAYRFAKKRRLSRSTANKTSLQVL